MHLDTVLFWDVLWCTPQKTNMEPENPPLQKGETPTNHQFLGSVLIFGSVLHMGRFVLFGVHIGKHPTRYSDNNASSPSQLPPVGCPHNLSTKLAARCHRTVLNKTYQGLHELWGWLMWWLLPMTDPWAAHACLVYLYIYMENHTLSRHMLVNMPWVLWGWLVMIGVSLKNTLKN